MTTRWFLAWLVILALFLFPACLTALAAPASVETPACVRATTPASLSSLAALSTTQPRLFQLEATVFCRDAWWYYLDPAQGWEFVGDDEGSHHPLVREHRLRAEPGVQLAVRTSEDPGWSSRPGLNRMDWTGIVLFQSQVGWNPQGYFTSISSFGSNNGDPFGYPNRKSVGWAMEYGDPAWFEQPLGFAHNGSQQYKVRLLEDGWETRNMTITVAAYPDGYVEWLVDDVWRAALVPVAQCAAFKGAAGMEKVCGSGPTGAPDNTGSYGNSSVRHEAMGANSGGYGEYVVHGTRIFVDPRIWR